MNETKLEMTRKERKKTITLRNELFSPLKKVKVNPNKSGNVDVPDLFDLETKKFKFTISPLKQQSINLPPPTQKQNQPPPEVTPKKESFQSRMKPPSSLNSMKSKIPTTTRTNLKSSAIPSDSKWRKYLNKK
jgi:hypothetical protein